jgi:segregation and condensation protein A
VADYRVNLDIFAGPMDLLLYLVRREEVDIYDIPIAEITDQYIRYIEMLKSLDIDLAGDFLVMASTLLQIKSAMLLPKTDTDTAVGGEDLADPRAELIRQLLEYKKFKDAANLLGAAADETGKRFARPGTIIEQLKPGAEPEVDIEQLSVWDLLEVFGSIVEATGGANFDVSHIKDDTPIDLYQIEILHRLQTEGAMSFERIFEGRTNRIVMIGLFLAILELIREKLVGAEQQKGAIYLRPLTEKNAEQAVQEAIFTLNEAGNGQAVQAKQPEKPSIPIAELPSESQQKASDSEYEKIESVKKQQVEN